LIRSLVEETVLNYVAPDSSEGLVSSEAEWVLFPPLLREIIGIRRRELGFKGISQYVTSLIRYDLLLGGPHTLFRGGDCTPEMCRSLAPFGLACGQSYPEAPSASGVPIRACPRLGAAQFELYSPVKRNGARFNLGATKLVVCGSG
jgi:hypothetical protein